MSDRLPKREAGDHWFRAPKFPGQRFTSLAVARKTLRDEFTKIYVVNLRGNAYTSNGKTFKRRVTRCLAVAHEMESQLTLLVKESEAQGTMNHISELRRGTGWSIARRQVPMGN